MKKKRKDMRGITLVALVVTIIVLIILAVISINIIFREGGILARAEQSKEKQKIGEYIERFNLIEANTLAKNKGKVTVELFLQEVENDDLIQNKDIQNEEGIGKVITSEGYIFEVTLKKENDVEVKYIGETGTLTKIDLQSMTIKRGETITAIVTLGEKADILKCKWEYSTEKRLGTDINKYTNTFSTIPETLELTSDTEGTYYLHVLTIDTEGNKIETISEEIIVEKSMRIVEVDAGFAIDEEGNLWKIGTTNTKIGTTTYKTFANGRNGHYLAIDTDGHLWTWGSNSYGALGDGTTTNCTEPKQIGSKTYTAVSGGYYHSLALDTDGYLWAWGLNDFGQIRRWNDNELYFTEKNWK